MQGTTSRWYGWYADIHQSKQIFVDPSYLRNDNLHSLICFEYKKLHTMIWNSFTTDSKRTLGSFTCMTYNLTFRILRQCLEFATGYFEIKKVYNFKMYKEHFHNSLSDIHREEHGSTLPNTKSSISLFFHLINLQLSNSMHEHLISLIWLLLSHDILIHDHKMFSQTMPLATYHMFSTLVPKTYFNYAYSFFKFKAEWCKHNLLQTLKLCQKYKTRIRKWYKGKGLLLFSKKSPLSKLLYPFWQKSEILT